MDRPLELLPSRLEDVASSNHRTLIFIQDCSPSTSCNSPNAKNPFNSLATHTNKPAEDVSTLPAADYLLNCLYTSCLSLPGTPRNLVVIFDTSSHFIAPKELSRISGTLDSETQTLV